MTLLIHQGLFKGLAFFICLKILPAVYFFITQMGNKAFILQKKYEPIGAFLQTIYIFATL